VAAEPPLTWVRPKWHRHVFELRAGTERLAVLRWVRSWGSEAEVETSFGTWHFHREGAFRHRITVTDVSTNMELAVVAQPRISKGELTLPNGEQVLWRKGNFWGSIWEWTRPDGTPLIRFQGMRTWGAQIALVAGDTFAARDRDTLLLLAIGWYLIVLRLRASSSS
jgi:hypothetical protein